MPPAPIRSIGLGSALLAACALGFALVTETWYGLAPCALCLVERWPYRFVVVAGLFAVVLPARWARIVLWLAVVALAADAAIAFVHVGVEAAWWPSPLPECAAPRFTGGSIAERLASMPARPGKPCDSPSYFLPGVPVSLALANLIFAAVFACGMATALTSRRRRR